jgi:hypothetical protein
MDINIKAIIERINTSESEFKSECINVLKNDEGLIYKNLIKNTDNLLSIYQIRYQIEKSKPKRSVFGYQLLLKNLENKNLTNEVEVLNIHTNSVFFTIFNDIKLNSNIGLLKHYDSQNLSELEKTVIMYKNKNLEINYYRFANGRLVVKL